MEEQTIQQKEAAQVIRQEAASNAFEISDFVSQSSQLSIDLSDEEDKIDA